LASLAAMLALALVGVLILLPSRDDTVSASEVVRRAWSTAERYQGLHGVLHWEAEWSERFPSGDQITRTFEVWFDLDNPGLYRLTDRDPEGQVVREMVRNGQDRMWQVWHADAGPGQEQIVVDEIKLSPREMEELGTWLVPSPFLDDLERLTGVLEHVEKDGVTTAAGRPAYIIQGELFGFGRPAPDGHIDPVTSTIQLLVDQESYWILDRVEHISVGEGDEKRLAGVVQRTRHFELVPSDAVPHNLFEFKPPTGAQVHVAEGLADYYAPAADAISLEQAAKLTSFVPVLPADLPSDLQPRPFFRYQGPGPAATFGIVYLGRPGRQAFLLELEAARPLPGATRLVNIGEQQGWMMPDRIDGRKFSLFLFEPEPEVGPDGRKRPGGVELQAWGLSMDEAKRMLSSLQPYQANQKP
jgi:hypothetical protein